MEAIVVGINTEIKDLHVEFYIREDLLAEDIDWDSFERLTIHIEHLGSTELDYRHPSERYQAFFETEGEMEVFKEKLIQHGEIYGLDEEDIDLEELDWE